MSDHAVHNYADPSAPPRRCQNCGTTLVGPYCSNCGQHDVDYHRSFHHLFHDLLENLFHFEGKFFVSVASLLAKPGQLTREFNAGRRQSQLNPLRFYLFVSVLFFLGLTLFSHGHLFDFDRREADERTRNVQAGIKAAEMAGGDLTPEQIEETGRLIGEAVVKKGGQLDQKAIAEIVDGVRQKPAQTPATISAPNTAPPRSGKPTTKITIDRTSSIGRSLAEKLGSGELKLSTIIDDVEHRIPMMLFLGVPLFALLLKLFYLRSRRYYIEHLIFSLHLHTWLFFLLMVGSGYLKIAGLGPPWLTSLVALALTGWAVWYAVSAFRAVYSESRRKTCLKIVLLMLVHGFLLMMVACALIGATLFWRAME